MAAERVKIGEILAADGPCARYLPGFRQRAEQIQMAERVQAAIEKRGSILLAEAGTGTGKSLAYLAPAIIAAKTGKKIGVVTSSIILQEQIARDIPLFLKALDAEDLNVSVLKGRSNFLCEKKWERMSQRKPKSGLAHDSFLPGARYSDDQLQDMVTDWARQTETGDISELRIKPPTNIWKKFACVDPEDCDGKRCSFYHECHYYRRRSAAWQANIVVCNYHLLFASFDAPGEILPQFDVLICDEGHEIADIARDFQELAFAGAQVDALRADLNEAIAPFDIFDPTTIGTKLVKCSDLAVRLSVELFEFYRSKSRGGDENLILSAPCGIDEKPLYDALCDLGSLSQAIALRYDPECLDDGYVPDDSPPSGIAAAMLKLAGKTERIANALNLTMQQQLPGDWVYWIQAERNKKPSVHAKPVNVAPYLRETMFNGKQSVIITSATLSTANTFEFIKEQHGIKVADELIVGTPFDMHKQSLWYLPPTSDLIEPGPTNREAFQKNIAEHISHILDITQGRALCLFTSYQSMRTTRDYLYTQNPGLKIMCQDDAPSIVLINEFRSDVHSTLLGTKTFFTGVDVPGEALSCLILDRLPFPIMSDPVVNVLSNRPGGFNRFTIPKMIIDLKQAIGRLIRTESDVGLVVILDSRLKTAKYRQQVWDSFTYQIAGTRELSDVANFVAGWDENGGD